MATFFNPNYQVASTANAANLIAQSGAIQGQMFANLGKIGAEALMKFRDQKEKKEKEEASFNTAKNFLTANPTVAKQLFDANDEDEISAVSKGLAKDPEGLKVINQLEGLRASTEARDKRIAMDDAVKSFASRLTGMTPNPQVAKLEEQIASNDARLNEMMSKPAVGASGIPRPSNELLTRGIEAENKRLRGQLDRMQSQVPMASTDVNSFIQAMGEPKTPEEAMLLIQEVNRRQAREDSLVGKNLDSFIKQAQLGQTIQGSQGKQFASNYTAPRPYYFDKSQAQAQIRADAKRDGVTLSKEDMETAMSGIRVIDMKDLRSTADKQIRELNLEEPITILEAAGDLGAFLDEGSPLSGQAAVEKLARMLQPTGILTEGDMNRVGGSKGLGDRIEAALAKAISGKLDENTETYLRKTANVMREAAVKRLQAKQGQAVSFLSNSFGITPDEVKEYTQFGQVLKNIPAGMDGSTAPSHGLLSW